MKPYNLSSLNQDGRTSCAHCGAVLAIVPPIFVKEFRYCLKCEG